MIDNDGNGARAFLREHLLRSRSFSETDAAALAARFSVRRVPKGARLLAPGEIIHPYSDFLMHDIGSGDGIPVLPLPEYAYTANLMRTAALWGLRTRNRLMHDGLSFTREEAIQRHRGQADPVRRRFNVLTLVERQQLIAFLDSL